MSGRKGQRYRTVVLTRKGLIAAICAQAAPYDWTRKTGDAPDPQAAA